MPHYKCAACRTRLRVSGSPAEMVGNLCPGCGSLLERAGDLAELIGFRAIHRLGDSTDAPRTRSHQRIADRVDGFIARRAGRLERERDLLGAERWLDDGDPVAAAVALPLPQPR
jgi:hypothetical protein